MTAVIAGTQFRGQFEARMKAIIDECRNDGNIILVIDEIHNIIGAGDAEHSMNAANILKPSLSNGEIQLIGTTTLKEYRKYINKTRDDINKGYSKRYYKAYNEAANEMNNGKIEQYNKEYAQKLGKRAANHDYANDKSYIDGYEKVFEKTMSKHYNRA